MKKIIFTLCLLSAVFMAARVKSVPGLPGSENGVNFTKASLADAIRMAKEQKKLIFIDVYATWCGPCKLLKLRTFPNKEAGVFFNKNFINLSYDGEKGDGLDLFQAYHLKAFPTLLILNSDGSAIIDSEGYMDPKSLIEFGKAGMLKSTNQLLK